MSTFYLLDKVICHDDGPKWGLLIICHLLKEAACAGYWLGVSLLYYVRPPTSIVKMLSQLTLPRFLVPSSLLLSKIQWRVDDRCWINLFSRHADSRFGCGDADTEEHTLVGVGWKISSGLPTGHV